jgi:hypothetical protein
LSRVPFKSKQKRRRAVALLFFAGTCIALASR